MKDLITFLIASILLAECRESKRGSVYKATSEFIRPDQRSTGFEYLTLLQNETVWNYDGKQFKVIVPQNWTGKDLAWGLIYFTGIKKSNTGGDIFFLLRNYDTSETQIVFDKNENSDFRDDQIFNIERNHKFDISFQNQQDSNACFIREFKLRNDISDSNNIMLHKVMTAKQDGALPARFVLYNDAKNCRRILLPDSNCITIQDFDDNGFFNDRRDRVMAGDIEKDPTLNQNPVRTKNPVDNEELIFRNNTYRVVSVNKYGNSAELLSLGRIRDTTEYLPEFTFLNEYHQMEVYNPYVEKKFTVIYIWGSWCIGCQAQATSFISLMDKENPIVDFVTLNAGDREQVILAYLDNKKYPFKRFRITNNTVNKLHVDAFPTYIVIDKSRRIRLRTSSVAQLGTFLESNKE